MTGLSMRACIDCGRPIPIIARRCDAHRIQHSRTYEAARGSRQQRGYGRDYMRIRHELLSTAESCEICGVAETEADPFEIDHVVPLSAGGSNDPSNLRVVHRSCNRARSPQRRN